MLMEVQRDTPTFHQQLALTECEGEVTLVCAYCYHRHLRERAAVRASAGETLLCAVCARPNIVPEPAELS